MKRTGKRPLDHTRGVPVTHRHSAVSWGCCEHISTRKQSNADTLSRRLISRWKFLFPLTSFHGASFDLFIKHTQVGLTFEEEQAEGIVLPATLFCQSLSTPIRRSSC